LLSEELTKPIKREVESGISRRKTRIGRGLLGLMLRLLFLSNKNVGGASIKFGI